MTSISRRGLLLAAGTTGLAGPGAARAQAPFPNRPINYVVAFLTGGTSDLVARLLATKLGQALSQPLVIDNRPGAGGIIGTQAVLRSVADGYTLLHCSISFVTVTPRLMPAPFDPLADIDPLAMIGSGMQILAVHPSPPVRSVEELVAYARQHPGKLNYGSSWVGTGNHITTEYFKRHHGIDMVHVPYKGAAPSLLGLTTNEVQVLFDPAIAPNVKAGKVRASAVTGGPEAPALPGVPSPEDGKDPRWNPPIWYNFIAAPRGLLAATCERIREAAAQVRNDPAFVQAVNAVNVVTLDIDGDALVRRIHDDFTDMGKLLSASGITEG